MSRIKIDRNRKFFSKTGPYLQHHKIILKVQQIVPDYHTNKMYSPIPADAQPVLE
jgi:hypothetical protein